MINGGVIFVALFGILWLILFGIPKVWTFLSGTEIQGDKSLKLGTEIGSQSQILFGGSFYQREVFLDGWNDLLQGAGDKWSEFKTAYKKSLSPRMTSNTKLSDTNLTTSGLFAVSRPFHVVERGDSRVIVYIATQGNDLYISWRLYLYDRIRWWLVNVWVVLSLSLFIVSTFTPWMTSAWGQFVFAPFVLLGSVLETNLLTSWFSLLFVSFLQIGFYIILVSWILYRDIFHLFWLYPNEFSVDDGWALALAVHESLMTGADQIGIDIAKLQPREFTMRDHRPRRRI